MPILNNDREHLEYEVRQREGRLWEIDSNVTPPITEFPPQTIENSGINMRTFGLLDITSVRGKQYFTEFYKNSQPKAIGIGPTVNMITQSSANWYEGWARTLNLLRNFVKIKKHDAVERAKSGWAHPTDDIEYLFRYFGFGYDSSSGMPQPILFKYPSNWPFYNSPKQIPPHSRWMLSELPNAKLLRIANRLESIINNPKCYKELLGQSTRISVLIAEMRIQYNVVNDCNRSHARYNNPHIYISISF